MLAIPAMLIKYSMQSCNGISVLMFDRRGCTTVVGYTQESRLSSDLLFGHHGGRGYGANDTIHPHRIGRLLSAIDNVEKSIVVARAFTITIIRIASFYSIFASLDRRSWIIDFRQYLTMGSVNDLNSAFSAWSNFRFFFLLGAIELSGQKRFLSYTLFSTLYIQCF